MKKILIFLIALIVLSEVKGQVVVPPGYSGFDSRNNWLAGAFNALNVPAGTGATLKIGQWVRSGALYYDSTGVDKGLYVWDGSVWTLIGTGVGGGSNATAGYGLTQINGSTLSFSTALRDSIIGLGQNLFVRDTGSTGVSPIYAYLDTLFGRKIFAGTGTTVEEFGGGIRISAEGSAYTGSNGILLTGTNFTNTLFTGIAASTQTVTGSTQSSGGLVLRSTSHATKGNIFFGESLVSRYVEPDGFLGLNVNPTSRLHIVEDGGVSNAPIRIDVTSSARDLNAIIVNYSEGGSFKLYDAATSGAIPGIRFLSSVTEGMGGVVMGEMDAARDSLNLNGAAVMAIGQRDDDDMLEYSNLFSVRNVDSVRLSVHASGRTAIGPHSATAWMHIRPGTTTNGPFKLTQGPLVTTITGAVQDGLIEYDGTHYYGIIGSTRYQLDQQGGGGSQGFDDVLVVDNATTANRVIDIGTFDFSIVGDNNNEILFDGATDGIAINALGGELNLQAAGDIVFNAPLVINDLLPGAATDSMMVWNPITKVPGFREIPTGAGGSVTSITGTANQIAASAATGAVTLSIPSVFSAPGTVTAATGLTVTSGGLTVTAGGALITAGGLTVTAGTTTITPLNSIGIVVNSAAGVLSSYAATDNAIQIGDAVGQIENSAITISTNDLVQPASAYHNFGATAGTGGYGVRDNAGTIEFKNSGGSWAAIGGGGSQTPWTSNINGDGFTLFGNDGSGESMTYSSTSHATKGNHIWGTTAKMFFDEVNNELHVGSATDYGAYGMQVAGQFIAGRGGTASRSDFSFSNNSTGSTGFRFITSTDAALASVIGYGPTNTTTLGGIALANALYIQSQSGPIALNANNGTIHLFTNNTAPTLTALTSGRVGLSAITAPTAWLHLPAGTTAASTAPLKFTSGSLQTTAEAGAVEFLTDKWYGTITTSAARKEITLNDAALTSGRVPYVTTNGRLTDESDFLWASNRLTVPDLTITDLPTNNTRSFFLVEDGSGNVEKADLITASAYVAVDSLSANQYTPTLTNNPAGYNSNVASSALVKAYYKKMGTIVEVWGTITAVATAGSTNSAVAISLPWASNLAAGDVTGGAKWNVTVGVNYTDLDGAVNTDATNDRVVIGWNSHAATSDHNVFFSFTYQVK